MTKASAVYDRETGEAALTLTGHATGSEKVCAAISAIAFSLAGYLANDPETEVLDCDTEPGHMLLRWRGGPEAMTALRMACIGLMQIELAEPEKIRTYFPEKIFKIGA